MEHPKVQFGSWGASAVEYSPPSFRVNGKTAVPVNFTSHSLLINLDVPRREGTGHSIIDFVLTERGCALLDLVPDPSSVLINGETVELQEVRAPDKETPLRIVARALDPGQPHRLEVDYNISSKTLMFSENSVRFGLFMSDLTPRGYLERYAPANLEYDSTPVRMQINILGSNKEHKIFCNAHNVCRNKMSWDLCFPEYFTCSSFYLHLTDRPVIERRAQFSGIEREVPVLIYGDSANLVDMALSDTLIILRELEDTYGPYAHAHLVIYITDDMEPGMAGMEYCGATMTTLEALGHELTHSWFARGVMPANGNAGWIDEAIASWRDMGYPQAKPSLRPAVNLAGFAPYRRHTTLEAYTLGRLFLSELDFEFQERGGLRPILKKFYLMKRRSVVTTELFQNFLEQEIGKSLEATFDRYVYGRTDIDRPEDLQIYSEFKQGKGLEAFTTYHSDLAKILDQERSRAPRPYTWNELQSLL